MKEELTNIVKKDAIDCDATIVEDSVAKEVVNGDDSKSNKPKTFVEVADIICNEVKDYNKKVSDNYIEENTLDYVLTLIQTAKAYSTSSFNSIKNVAVSMYNSTIRVEFILKAKSLLVEIDNGSIFFKVSSKYLLDNDDLIKALSAC